MLAAAGLWIFVKLPQEYWIHIAELDFTDTVRDHPAFGVAVVVALVAAAIVVVFVVVPRLPAPDWSWRMRAGPVASTPARNRFVRVEVLEQVALLTLLCTIFASILPGIDATGLQITVGVTAIVLANAAINLAAPPALLAANLVLIYLANAVLGERRDFDLGIGLFFAFLITTIIWLYDAYRPLYHGRFPERTAAGPADEVRPRA